MFMMFLRRITVIILTFVFITSNLGPVHAQSQVILPVPGVMVGPSTAFVPALLKGLRVYPKDPLHFDFIVDTGDASAEDGVIRPEIEKIVRYFLSSLTIPEKELWVNLSPYESTRIIPEALGRTEMGRDLLAQDYILKQLTSSLMYPEKDLGRDVWRRIYAALYEQYGMTDVPLDTFNKVWIIPDEATVYVQGETVVIQSSHLKVMLEADYVALGQQAVEINPEVEQELQGTSETRALAQKVLREIVIPVLEKEVNEGQNFAVLRQITRAMVLAVWFKRHYSESLLGQAYVDANKVQGIDLAPAGSSTQIWQQYVAAFKKGVFNFIKEEHDENLQEIMPRKYFSGGFRGHEEGVREVNADQTQVQEIMRAGVGRQLVAGVNLDAAQGSQIERRDTQFTGIQQTIYPLAGLSFEMSREGLAEITGPAMFMAAVDAAMTPLVKEIFQLNGQVHNLDQADYEAGLQEMYEVFLRSEMHAGFYFEENLKDNEFVTFLESERKKGFPKKFEDFLSMVRAAVMRMPEGREKIDFEYGIAIWIMRYIDANAIYEVQDKGAGDVIHSLWHLVVGEQKSRSRKFLCDSYSILMLLLAEEMGLSSEVLTRVPVVLDDKGEYLFQAEEPNPLNLQGHVAVLFQFLDRTIILDQGNIGVAHQEIQVVNAEGGWNTIVFHNQNGIRGETVQEIGEYYRLFLSMVRQSRAIKNLEQRSDLLNVKEVLQRVAIEIKDSQRMLVVKRFNSLKANYEILIRRITLLATKFQGRERDIAVLRDFYAVQDMRTELLAWVKVLLRKNQLLESAEILQYAEREFSSQFRAAAADSIKKLLGDLLGEISGRMSYVQGLLLELNPSADFAGKVGGVQNLDNQLKGGIDLDPAAMTFTEMGNIINRFTSEPGQSTNQNITGFVPRLFSLTPFDPQTFFAPAGV